MSQEFQKEIDDIQKRIENSRNLRDVIRLKRILALSEAALWQIEFALDTGPRSPAESINAHKDKIAYSLGSFSKTELGSEPEI